MNDAPTIALAAAAIQGAFRAYLACFRQITRRAATRFAARDWQAMQHDNRQRLALYGRMVDRTCDQLKRLMGSQVHRDSAWGALKGCYSQRIQKQANAEIAATFFNSITRRQLHTMGVQPEVEFLAAQMLHPRPGHAGHTPWEVDQQGSLAAVVAQLLRTSNLGVDFEDFARDTRRVTRRLARHGDITRIEMLPNVFYRDMAAYRVGRAVAGSETFGLVIALLHGPNGVYVDAVLDQQQQIRVLFSFTRSHFHVLVDRVADLIGFLKPILPHKRLAELYTAIGFHKHGKTELYHELTDHMAVCGSDRFDFSPGQRGMVMIAFNMPRDDLVFKVIRDRFERPKAATRREVMAKYDYVFTHDRAGRLIDAHTFEHLTIDLCCLEADLLEELQSRASESILIRDEQIVLKHVYVERRVTPLDLYLREADPAEALAAVRDFGQAIKDLAHVDVFPGDVLTKNFGVTALGRVVFYDYDELCPLSQCNFRRIPPPRDSMDEMAAEPWYWIDEDDVFPEEFQRFLAMNGDHKDEFLKHHADLLDVDFWTTTQQQITAGEYLHIYPYQSAQRLMRRKST